MMALEDARQYAPATQRNRQAILDVLLRVLPREGNVLEVASGTGEHAIFFAPPLSPRRWIPSDPNPLSRASINAWRAKYPLDTLDLAIDLNVCDPFWPKIINEPIAAIVNINMIHIAPWSACLGLMAGAGRLLPSGGVLYLYGPFQQPGKHTAPSNLAFDSSLRSQNPAWGVRHLDAVVAAANDQGLSLGKIVEMPANNLSVVFNR
jgi:hypothetical protein